MLLRLPTVHCLLFTAYSLLLLPLSAEPPAGWPMRSHDARRTGRALVNGPRHGDRVWRTVAEGGVNINIEPAVTEAGVFFGTWGLFRKHGEAKTDWDKMDGRIYGLDRMTGKPLWPPLHPGLTPYAYAYDGRKPTAQDQPAGPGLHWNFYNGTVEGTPAADPNNGTLYVGRGDGVLYAVDPKAGKVRWKFRTFDPARPDDPEGGGEVIGGPLFTPAGVIVIATWAAPHRPNPPKKFRHETNAVYGIDRHGQMLWRYPEKGTVEQVFCAPPALSADGQRVYALTTLPDRKEPCEFFALDVRSGQLAWKLAFDDMGGHDLAVGAGGRLFVAGMRQGIFGSAPVAFAIDDRKQEGEIAWGPVELDVARPPAHFSGGVALFEVNGAVRDLYFSTAVVRQLNGRGGELHRLDPNTGKILDSWDPEKATPPCMGGLTDISLDNEGVIYVGVRGRTKTLLDKETRGRMYALRLRDGKFEVLWSLEVDGHLDWASPAIGPDGGLFFGSCSRLGPVAMILPRPPDENVKDADPVFYGVRD